MFSFQIINQEWFRQYLSEWNLFYICWMYRKGRSGFRFLCWRVSLQFSMGPKPFLKSHSNSYLLFHKIFSKVSIVHRFHIFLGNAWNVLLKYVYNLRSDGFKNILTLPIYEIECFYLHSWYIRINKQTQFHRIFFVNS